MTFLEKIALFFSSRDVFDCGHCRKRSRGKFCTRCTGKIPKGWYTDDCGHVNKPSVPEPPVRKEEHMPQYVDIPKPPKSLNKMQIILKSGKEINVASSDSIDDVCKSISLEDGSCLRIGKSFILCAEIAAVMDMN